MHGRVFELLAADEFTFEYMHNNRHVFEMADPAAALRALKAQLAGARAACPAPPCRMRSVISKIAADVVLVAALEEQGLPSSKGLPPALGARLDGSAGCCQ